MLTYTNIVRYHTWRGSNHDSGSGSDSDSDIDRDTDELDRAFKNGGK